MLLSKKKKAGNEHALGGLKNNTVPGYDIVIQTSLPEGHPQATDWFIPTPVYGYARSNRQEEGSHA